MNYFLLIFVLGVTSIVNAEIWEHIQENREGSLWCDGRERYISVESAEFKYDNSQTIPEHELRSLPNIKCSFDFKRKVKEMCEGKTKCKVKVDRRNFVVSSCQKYKKILYVYYECIDCSGYDRKKREVAANSTESPLDDNDQVNNIRSKRQSGRSQFCYNLQSSSRQTPDELLKKKIDKNIPSKEDFICPNDVFTQKHVCHNYGQMTATVAQNCAAAKENNRGKSQWLSSNTYSLFVSSSSALIGYTHWSDMCKFKSPIPKFKCNKRGSTWSCYQVGNAIAHHNARSGHYLHQYDIMS